MLNEKGIDHQPVESQR